MTHSRLKILACSYIERTNNILNNAQIQVLDVITHKDYNIFCDRVAIDEATDYYRIKVCGISSDDVIDTSIIDSSGGFFGDDYFTSDVLDDEIKVEIIELFTNHFIVEF